MPNPVRSDNFAAAARLTSAFYSWEERGRGWQVWPYPVELEPPFRPFAFHSTELALVTDDARKPTALSRWFEGRFGGKSPTPELEADVDEPPAERAQPFAVSEIQVALPPDVKVTADLAEHLLLSLSSCREPVSFEIVGTSEAIVVQFAASERDAPQVREQLRAHFPDAIVSDSRDYLVNACGSADNGDTFVADFGLSHEFMRPTKVFSRFDADPLVGIVGALSDLEQSELAVVQVLFQAAQAPWSTSIMRSVTDWDGADFFADAPELVPLAKQKTTRPLFACVLRVAVRAGTRGRCWQLAERIGGTLAQLAEPTSNEFIALENTEYPDDAHFADILARRTRRTGALLNSEELVSLVHPPSTVVRSPRLRRDERRTKQAPKELAREGLVLGLNAHGGVSRPVALTEDQRLRHMHVVGASGTGKSTLLVSLIAQDIEQGRGFAVLDPHGDLIDEVLCRIPDRRIDDVVLVDPADSEFPIGFNILSAHSELEKTLLASDLVAIFRRLSTSWGDQMTSVLSNAILAFLESTQGGTIADLRRLLVEADYRTEFLETVQDREVVYYWQKEFPLLTGRPQAPLLTRLDAFLRPKLVRRMVTQPTALDFGSIMNEGKILLVKLSQGAIGEENASLLGSFFVAKLNQLAMGRQAIKESERRPFYLYIDEFQHFVTPSMATLMTGARKYRLGLILAHQELRQLLNQDRDVAGAVLANAATRVAFRGGDDDARKLEDGFANFSARDLQNLGRGQAVCRVDRADWDFSMTTSLLPSLSVNDHEHGELVLQKSRSRYGTPLKSEPETIEPLADDSLADERRSQGADTSREAPAAAAACAIVVTKGLRPSPTPGRGGAQHKYLQELIRRWADANSWRATIEKQVMGGLGSIDVLLERDEHVVACEIGISSTIEHEVQNIQKCVSAGFDCVLSVIPDRRKRAYVQRNLSEMFPERLDTILALSVDELFTFLGSLEKATPVTALRGYRVSVRRSTDTPHLKGVKRASIVGIVARAIARLRP